MPNKPPAFTKLTDLASAKLGGQVLYATDEFFAEKENLIKPGRGIFIPDKYTDQGKWMDGWESRRRRTPGHDWVVLKLAAPGRIRGLDIDTHHFLGNYPPFASVDAVFLPEEPQLREIEESRISWTGILPKSPLGPGSQHFFDIDSDRTWTHVRLHIYPDGGVARFRVYGEVVKELSGSGELPDLAAALNGGLALMCNDMFFGDIKNLIAPGRGVNMGDGWETRRCRIPGNRDWVILRLACPGIIKKILVDTCHFKGNYPESCSLEGCYLSDDPDNLSSEMGWIELLPRQKLRADEEHIFEREITAYLPVSHVRFNIFPDGGVSRLRLFGAISA